MLHGLIVLKFWEESYLGPVLDSCWFVLTRVRLVLTRVGLVLIRVDSCWFVSDSSWFVLTRVDSCWFVLTRVDLCWYSYIRIDLISCIDVILTNKQRSFQHSCVIETSLSDFHDDSYCYENILWETSTESSDL